MNLFDIAFRVIIGVFLGAGAWLGVMWALYQLPDCPAVTVMENYVYRLGTMAGMYMLSVSFFITLLLKL